MEHISKVLDDICQQEVKPIKTGIPYLDETIGGYYPGEMTTICGEENCCKTAFVIHQLCKIAIGEKVPTLLLLNYMLERNFLSSMIAYYYSIEVRNLHDIFEKEQYKDIVANFMSILKESPLYIMKAGWYEDTPVFERIVSFVETKNVKMMFVDETILDLTVEYTAKKRCMRDIAVEKNIPVIVTGCIWCDCAIPLLSDLGKSSYLHGHDEVISFTNFEDKCIFVDEQGNDLHDTISIKVLNHRGMIKKETHCIPKPFFFFRNFDTVRDERLPVFSDIN